jgi:hypothetical protein
MVVSYIYIYIYIYIFFFNILLKQFDSICFIAYMRALAHARTHKHTHTRFDHKMQGRTEFLLTWTQYIVFLSVTADEM